jgi:hypothetical protein
MTGAITSAGHFGFMPKKRYPFGEHPSSKSRPNNHESITI